MNKVTQNILVIGLFVGLIISGVSITIFNLQGIVGDNNLDYGIKNVTAASGQTCDNVDGRIKEIETHGYRYAKATVYEADIARVTHNLNLSDYKPIVTLAPNDNHAYIIYNVINVTPNYFDIRVENIEGFVFSVPSVGYQVNIFWRY